jgi:hypothetical protein
MYEQYTDKQIVEMLVPKLKKLCPYYDWNDYLNGEGYETWLHFIAILYKSAYIRGQLGRSFVIGEPKQTEHWVPATKDNVKVGSKVRMIDEEGHRIKPCFFPKVGTVGTVTKVGLYVPIGIYAPRVQWPKGSTSVTDEWYCDVPRLEVLLCE